ncbi:two-component system histidine kinase PnpS [Alkalibacterium sp. MB6]|uniref:two-component system histidine kinase PnpS n=1 Tax=Alkalibacterium sp. MB6 TaxID=2081965 RepID=UPI001379DB64|nr:ATP-binding protein [Alkalibacterium sp. MB6]
MKQLRSRIMVFFTIMTILFNLLFFMIVSSTLENQSVDQQGEHLQSQLLTLSSQLTDLSDTNEAGLTERLDRTARIVSERLTFILPSGEVLYDSHADINELDNHINRPEIQQLIQEEEISSFNRRSSSTGDTQYYVATSIFSETDDLLGYLRLSKNVEDMAGLTTQTVLIISLFMTISIGLAFLFISYWTRKISKPLDYMKDVTEKLSKQDYDTRYYLSSFDDIDELGMSINTLASNLDNQMQEIQENDTRLRELINHLVIGVLVVDNDRNIDMVNLAMNEMLEDNLYGHIGKPYNEVIHSVSLVEMIEKAFEEETLQNREITMYYPEEKIVDANVVPIFGQFRQPINFIVLLYDITEIRRLEKVRSDFVANVSHELRTPITALKGFSETLLDGAMHEEDVLVEFLKIIYKESIRLDRMVEDILHLSKLEQRQAITHVEAVRVKDVITEVANILHQKMDLKRITFTIHEEGSVEAEVDRDQFKQIALNLIGNAVSYTPEEGQVTVRIKKDKNEALILFEDNGIGIPADKQVRIFERFYRVDKARSRNSGGTGLGLSIVKWLVETSRGRIELESEEGKGSTFSVWLPLST